MRFRGRPPNYFDFMELKMRFRFVWLTNLAMLVFFAMAAMAQDTASITGTVSDRSGAAIASAQVTVDSTRTGN